jgi:glycosyltransferase involved in cell wall biosynthesis
MSLFRVLVVTNLWPYEGDPSYGSFVQAQMESLRPLGVEYDLVFANGRLSRGNYFRALTELRRRLKSKPYDLIHAHMGLAGWIGRCQFRIPLVISFLGNDIPGKVDRDGRTTLYGHSLELSSMVLARLAYAVIVKSQQMKRLLRLKSAYVIPNGVDLSRFRLMDRDTARRALGLNPQKKYALFPYRPEEPRKRYDLVKAVVEKARATVPELEILAVARLPQEQVATYMNAADVMVMASMLEGSPNAVKEALAVNLPLVTVDVGDTAELLEGTQGNFLVPRDVEVMTAKVIEICRSGGRSSSRECIERRLSMEQIAAQVVQVYQGVMAHRKRQSASNIREDDPITAGHSQNHSKP